MSAISKMITPDGAAYDIRDANALRAAAAAPSFSDSASYAEGDYVTHDGLLYRATAARVAGAWNSGSGFEVFPLWKKANPYPFVTAAISSGTVTLQPFANNQLDLTAAANVGTTAFTVAFAASPVSDTMRDMWFMVKVGTAVPTITWPSDVFPFDDDDDNLVADITAKTVFHVFEYAPGKFLVERQVAESEVISAKSYVRDGLVAMWDAVENAGWGVHDTAVTSWKDLTGNGYDLPLANATVSYPSDDTITIGPESTLASGKTADTVNSIEIVFSASKSAYVIYKFICTGSARGIGCRYKALIHVSSYLGTTIGTDAAFALASYSFSNAAIYKNAEAQSVSSTSTANMTDIGSAGISTNTSLTLNIKCVRLYSRALTAAEVAANYGVDQFRFGLT